MLSRAIVALSVLLSIAPVARAAPPAIDDIDGRITITVGDESPVDVGSSSAPVERSVRWGDEIDIAVTALNGSGQRLAGGIYVSFDQEVFILSAGQGTILRPGATAFDLRTSAMKALGRPLIELWLPDWAPNAEQRLVIKVLPVAGPRIRVLARSTFVKPGATPTALLFPRRVAMRSPSPDEMGFPTGVLYLNVTRHGSLRRVIRRFEQRIRQMDEREQRHFASLIAAELENPNGLLGGDMSAISGIQKFAPYVVTRLRGDPIVALSQLRCLMIDLECKDAMAYFGAPLELFGAVTKETRSRYEAKQLLGKERGGDELSALLEASGFTYALDDKTGAISVQTDTAKVEVPRGSAMVPRLLDEIAKVLGATADKPYLEAGGMSFAKLRTQLSGAGAK